MENSAEKTKTETGTEATGIDKYVPGPVSVLLEWVMLLISTVIDFFKRKN